MKLYIVAKCDTYPIDRRKARFIGASTTLDGAKELTGVENKPRAWLYAKHLEARIHQDGYLIWEYEMKP